MVKKNILGTIGTTPMVRINRLCPNPNVKIFAKLEGFILLPTTRKILAL